MLAAATTMALCLLSLATCFTWAAETTSWNGKHAAIILTYDDALQVHLDKVIPELDRRHLLATFYITVNTPGFKNRITDWREAAAKGHELGNHTLFHPCAGSKEGRDWVSPDYDLDTYSLQRITDEIDTANTVLTLLDHQRERTYAYTCGDIAVGKQIYKEMVASRFVAARGVSRGFVYGDSLDLYNINAFGVHEQSSEELIAQARQAINEGAMLVYLFHGVGGEHSLNVSEQSHRALLDYLGEQEKNVWVTTMLQVAKYLKTH